MRAIVKRIASPFLKKASAYYFRKPRRYRYKNIRVIVEPTVFPPLLTTSTRLLLGFIDAFQLKNKTLLELGCGCGIISILAAKKGAMVTATDINDVALIALAKNAKSNQVNLQIINSDLFSSLTGMDFDYIIINPPFYPRTPENVAEQAWFCGENFEYFKRLFAELPQFIKPTTKTYMILSEDCAVKTITAIAAMNHLHCTLVEEKKTFFEKNFIFEINYEIFTTI